MALPQHNGVQYSYGEADNDYDLGSQPLAGSYITSIYERLSNLRAGSLVLDLGCGAGRIVRHAPAKRSWRWLGIDHDPTAISQAHEVLGDSDKAIQGDITDPGMALISGPVHAVVSHRVLHALPTHLQEPLITTVATLLPEGAEAHISYASNEDWKVDALGDYYKPGAANDCSGVMFHEWGAQRNEPFTMRFFSPGEVETMAEQAGLTVAEVLDFTEPSGYEHIAKAGLDNHYRAVRLVR